MTDDWKCAGCAKPSPNRRRICDCPTNVVTSTENGKHVSAWKRGPEESVTKAEVVRKGKTVTIKMLCTDDYAAMMLYDEITMGLKGGELSLALTAEQI